MAQILVPQVAKKDAEGFSKVWLYNGLAVTLDDTSVSFATDFANLVIKSFFEQILLPMIQAQQQAQANINAALDAKAEPESKLIVEA